MCQREKCFFREEAILKGSHTIQERPTNKPCGGALSFLTWKLWKKTLFEFQVNENCWNRREVSKVIEIPSEILNEINDNNKMKLTTTTKCFVGTCTVKVVLKKRCFLVFTSKFHLNLSQNAFRNVLNSFELYLTL